ncbi:MAG: DUF1786 family protein [Desulfobacteraceae bacterium]|jgi:uncharacterized protein (DUF1786 family)
MGRFLILDVGAGTVDLLCYDMDSNQHFKAVAKSPVKTLAEKAESISVNLLISGTEMGGGALSSVLKRRAQEAVVVMSASSAATIHHNLDKVRSWGIKVVDDKEAEDLGQIGSYHTLTTDDLEVDRLEKIVKALGVSFSFEVVGLCAQDHGRPPEGVSHLDYRHEIFKSHLDKNPFPHALLYGSEEVPATFSRLRSMAQSAKALPANEIYVMDSGMAAILGASMDPRVREKERVLTLDVATSHTVGAAIQGEEITGFFEYHTSDITLKRLEVLLRELADGTLEHKQILEEGGHGAYIRKAFGFETADLIIATGPKRQLVENSQLPIQFGSPLGDNMMTGTVGVLESIRRRKGMRPIAYL